MLAGASVQTLQVGLVVDQQPSQTKKLHPGQNVSCDEASSADELVPHRSQIMETDEELSIGCHRNWGSAEYRTA